MRAKPIFEAAKSVLDVECTPIFLLYHIKSYILLLSQVTTHRFHAKEIAAAMTLDVDAIVALSGDGLPHEIINGLVSRKDAVSALHIPVVPVPTGSANGFNLSLHGPEVGPCQVCFIERLLM